MVYALTKTEYPLSPKSFPTTVICFILAIQNCERENLKIVLIYTFLMAKGIESFFFKKKYFLLFYFFL